MRLVIDDKDSSGIKIIKTSKDVINLDQKLSINYWGINCILKCLVSKKFQCCQRGQPASFEKGEIFCLPALFLSHSTKYKI